MKCIASRDNPTFKHLRALADDGRYRRDQQATILDGPHLVQGALAYAIRVRHVAVTKHALANREIAAIVEAAAQTSCEILELPASLLRSISPVESPSGIIAEIDIPEPSSAISDREDLLVLAGVQDAGNLGTLLRTAAAAGCRHVWLSLDCAQAWSPKVLRAGMGAHFVIQIEEQADLRAMLDEYSGQVIATALSTNAMDIYQTDLRSPTAWLFGAEGQGLSAEMMALADRLVRIPMPGGMESLNVAASAAVCLFEQLRQRR
ncbi:MAG TPA: RNA methyltransferase [Rhodocyclaceae bacterium]|nr:RNA methyltransferase [Rhodocyclaceae bacterium]